MRELSKIFVKAKEKKVYKNLAEFREVLNAVMESDVNLELDWDDGVVEEWARIIKQQVGIVCMLNIKIGVAFIRRYGLNSQTLTVLDSLFLVDVLDYSSEIWCIDLDFLEERIPEIVWGVDPDPDVIDVAKFSLDDLYFATV